MSHDLEYPVKSNANIFSRQNQCKRLKLLRVVMHENIIMLKKKLISKTEQGQTCKFFEIVYDHADGKFDGCHAKFVRDGDL